jgi:hypothetical protein
MHQHTTCRGRSHISKQNSFKQKIPATEKANRISQKKPAKLFSSWKALHPVCKRNAATKNSVPPGTESRVKIKSIYQHSLTVIKKSSVYQGEYRRLLL